MNQTYYLLRQCYLGLPFKRLVEEVNASLHMILAVLTHFSRRIDTCSRSLQ